MKSAVAEARAAVADDDPPAAATVVRGPWSVGIVGLVAARLAEDRRPPGRRRCRPRRRRPRLVPERRLARSRRPRSSAARTCSSASAAMPAPPASRSRPSAGTSSASASSPSRPRRSRPIRASTIADRPRPAGDRRRLRASTASWPARAVRSGEPRSARRRPRADRDPRPGRHRRPQPADPAPRARRARRHRLRPARHRRDRPRGRPARRRGTPDEPAGSAGFESLQLDIRDVATSGSHPQAAAVLADRGQAPVLAGERHVTRSSASGTGSRPSFSAGSLGRWLAPALSVVGLLVVAFVTLNLLQRPRAVRRRLEWQRQQQRERQRQRQRQRRPGPDAGAIERRRRPGRRQVQGLDRLRQGRQHLGPDRQGRQAADDRRRQFDAVLVARRDVRLLHPDRPTASAVGRRRAWFATTSCRCPSVMRVKADGSGDPCGRRQRQGHDEGPDLARVDPRSPSLSPDGRTLAMVSDRPDPANERRRPPVLRPHDEEVARSRTSPRRRRSVTRIPSGDPTARTCSTSATVVTVPRATPIIYRWTVATAKGTPVTGPGYLEPSLLARRDATSPRPRRAASGTTSSSSMPRTGASCCG